MTEPVHVEFLAYLPDIQTAIKINGKGDGARIQLDVSRDSVPEAMRILLLAGTVFRVSIDESLTETDNETKKGPKRSTINVARRRD